MQELGDKLVSRSQENEIPVTITDWFSRQIGNKSSLQLAQKLKSIAFARLEKIVASYFDQTFSEIDKPLFKLLKFGSFYL